MIAAGDRVRLERSAPEADHVAATVAQLFLQAQTTRRRIELRTRLEVRALLEGREEAVRQDELAVDSFRELLRGASGVAPVIRAMHEAGYLDVLLPEFQGLDCLAQADGFHAYTVDEHTLAALAALEGWRRSPARSAGRRTPPAPAREDLLRQDLLHRTADRDLLRLGLLLHDAGKVGGAVGHVARGVGLVSGSPGGWGSTRARPTT